MEEKNIIFEFQFQLRKECPQLKNLLDIVADLNTRGFSVLFSLAPDNNRWLVIKAFERSANHPTMEIQRLLQALSPTIPKALSAFNLGISFGGKVSFIVEDDMKTFTVNLSSPKNELHKQAILANLKMLGF